MSYPIKEPHTRRTMTYRLNNGPLVHVGADQIHSVNSIGVLLFQSERTRTLIPWHRVEEFSYDAQDAGMRETMSTL